MKSITIEIDEKYASLLTFTVIGYNIGEVNVTTAAFDLLKTDKIIIDEKGKAIGIK